MATGIQQRHGSSCKRKSGCDCPWRAFVYSVRDGKKIRKQFATKAAAVAWRDDSRSAVRKRTLRAPTSTTLREVMTVIYVADGETVQEPRNRFQSSDMGYLPGLRPGDLVDSPLNPRLPQDPPDRPVPGA